MKNLFRASCPKLAIKVVGYLDFKTGKITAAKPQQEAKKNFVNDFASMLKGIAAKGRLILSKKLLRAKWTFQRYCTMLSAAREVRKYEILLSIKF